MIDPPDGYTDGYADTRLGRLHYVHGGSGAPLILLHGGHGGWTHWIANLPQLAQAHTVFALDMPGFGRSCDGVPDPAIDDVALPVWDAINAMRATLPAPLRGHPVGIGAFSFGTIVATRLALTFPQEVQAVLLVNPPGLGDVSDEVKQIQARASERARTGGLRAGLEVTLRELLLCRPDRRDDDALDLLEDGVRNTRFVSRSLSRATRLYPMLEQLQVPAHVALGERDPHQRHELEARRTRLGAILGASNVHLFADAAHWLQYDQPEGFASLALSVFGNRRKRS